MIRIAVVDASAESRGRIISQLDSFLRVDAEETRLLPRISLRPASPQELKFAPAADLFLLGSELIDADATEVSRLKKLFPNIPLVVLLSPRQSKLSFIEQIVRLGADDVFTSDVTAQYFFRRLLLLARKTIHKSSGKLVIVDGGKGGVGVTTIAAALAEIVSAQGKKVIIVDCDFETQDCSRFLQARPFLNENLRMILEEERAVTEESIEQSLSQVWEDDLNLRCMTAVAEADDLYDPRSRLPRIFLSVLEMLDSRNDLVVIDIGCARSSLQKMFYRVADKLIFVVNDDPATLYASVDKLTRARSFLAAGAQLCVLENTIGINGLGNKLLRREFSNAARLDKSSWAPEAIPFCKLGQRWPGSGATFFSQSRSSASRALMKMATFLALSEAEVTPVGFGSLLSKSRETPKKAVKLQGAEVDTTIYHSAFETRISLQAPQAEKAEADLKPLSDDAGLTEQGSVNHLISAPALMRNDEPTSLIS